MTITWYGQSCFKITNQGGHLTIITDPFDKKIGLIPPRGNADIVTVSHDHFDHNNIEAISGDPFIIETPGEYEVKGIRILGVSGYHDNVKGKDKGSNTMYLIKIDDLKICHFGDIGQEKLTNRQLELISDVDILMIPVGGVYTINAKEAVKIIGQVEPRIVIPSCHKSGMGKIKADEVNIFVKEFGVKAEEIDKLKVSKKDLPQDDVKLFILKPQK